MGFDDALRHLVNTPHSLQHEKRTKVKRSPTMSKDDINLIVRRLDSIDQRLDSIEKRTCSTELEVRHVIKILEDNGFIADNPE